MKNEQAIFILSFIPEEDCPSIIEVFTSAKGAEEYAKDNFIFEGKLFGNPFPVQAQMKFTYQGEELGEDEGGMPGSLEAYSSFLRQ